MNRKQRWVVAVGLAVCAGMAVVPPWKHYSSMTNSVSTAYEVFWNGVGALDVTRLAVQWVAVAFLTGVFAVLLAGKASEASDPE